MRCLCNWKSSDARCQRYLVLFLSVAQASSQFQNLCPMVQNSGQVSFATHLTGSLITVLRHQSLLSCAEECARRRSCKSFNYFRLPQICELNRGTSSEAKCNDLQERPDVVYSEISTWKINIGNCEDKPCPDNSKCVSGQSHTCEITDCGKQPQVPFATPSTLDTAVGKTVNIRCLESSMALSQTFSTCKDDGQWDVSGISCEVPSGWRHIHGHYLQVRAPPFTTDVHLSLTGCLALCNTTLGCISFNYRPDDQLCRINMNSVFDSYVQIDANCNWELVLKLLPVFHLGGPNGRYTMTKTEAQNACEQRETTMATYAQLAAAYQLGYDYCHCGWLSDTSIGYNPQVFAHQDCGRSLTGLVSCAWLAKWDVFCVNHYCSNPYEVCSF